MFKSTYFWFLIILLLLGYVFFSFPKVFSEDTTYNKTNSTTNVAQNSVSTTVATETAPAPLIPPLNTTLFDQKLLTLANNPPDPIVYTTVKTITQNAKGKSITTITKVPVSPQPVVTHLWPVKTVYPNAGALLPFNRIVAYYGNLYSTKMGVLGEYPEDQMLQMLQIEVQKWQTADPSTPVIPALDYIAVVAQGSPGASGMYRTRMPDSEIDKVITMASKINGIVFLDVQVGLSNVQTEVPFLEKYLKMPNVNLAIDPEFSMKTGARPGTVIGTFDATDINFVSNYLANLVTANNLPPKILVVHRFTEGMVTNYKQIKTIPQVQIVMNMDGWGDQALVPGSSIMTPTELMKLNPQPIYIQYQ
jgi:hypothetical protein